MRIDKNRYLQIFCLIVVALGIARAVGERNGSSDVLVSSSESPTLQEADSATPSLVSDGHLSVPLSDPSSDTLSMSASNHDYQDRNSRFLTVDGAPSRHRIVSVKSYAEAFPDAQDIQIVSARRWGVSPARDREDAERRKSELVYIGSNVYFFVEPLYWSIPYLVPRASVLLQDIGRNFIDSLQVKGLPAHRIIVTSVMRSEGDVARMRRYNGNATENSCHMYGTTFDIAYNRYLLVREQAATYSKQNTIADVRLKQVLAEVLNDLRKRERCYVKYEVKQGCFHITVR